MEFLEMLSSDANFKELLLLHGRDRRLGKLVDETKLLPGDQARLTEKINIEKKSIDLAVTEWKELEAKNNTLEKDLFQISDKIAKNKVRQLDVKKNEEYQALEMEINSLLELQSQKEDEQIEVLLKIDDARSTAELAQEKIAERVEHLEMQLEGLKRRKIQVVEEASELEIEINEARTRVPNPMLATYDRVKKIVTRAPFIAPLELQKCTGCHLKVSNDVVSNVLVEQKLTQCDQCGRIVYVER